MKTPHDFQPTRQKGIVSNPDPGAPGFAIIFTQNGSKDEWRDLGGYTKTSTIVDWPAAHLTICEILREVKKMVASAGGDFEISDESEICHDYHEQVYEFDQEA